MYNNLISKAKESFLSVLPITLIVLVLRFTVAPLSGETCGLFLAGAFLLIIGMTLFTRGADIAMMPMGENIGAHLIKTRKLSIMIAVVLLMGIAITGAPQGGRQ